LRVIFAGEGGGVGECTDEDAVDIPLDGGARPVNGVVVEGGLGGADWDVGCAVVGCGVSFAEVIGFYYSGVTAEPFLELSVVVISQTANLVI